MKHFAITAMLLICGFRTDLIAQLNQQYGETRQGVTVVDDVSVLELWASKETGSWTVLQTHVDGLTCVQVVGRGFVPKIWGVKS